MLIPIPILIDLCPHLVASMTAVHENLSGGLQTLKYCIYVYFDNRPVYEASLLSLWKHTTVCKISLCISCWIKNSWVLSPESWMCWPYFPLLLHFQWLPRSYDVTLENIVKLGRYKFTPAITQRVAHAKYEGCAMCSYAWPGLDHVLMEWNDNYMLHLSILAVARQIRAFTFCVTGPMSALPKNRHTHAFHILKSDFRS